jgi:hypothetical protein
MAKDERSERVAKDAPAEAASASGRLAKDAPASRSCERRERLAKDGGERDSCPLAASRRRVAACLRRTRCGSDERM